MDQVSQGTPPQASRGQQPSVVTTNETPKSPMKIILVIVIILVLLVGGYIAFSSLSSSKRTDGESVGKPPTTQQDTDITSPPSTDVEGPYVGTQTITLSDITGGSSIGSATRTLTADSVRYKVTAKLPKPEGGFYQVWAVKPGESQRLLGRLIKPGEEDSSLKRPLVVLAELVADSGLVRLDGLVFSRALVRNTRGIAFVPLLLQRLLDLCHDIL